MMLPSSRPKDTSAALLLYLAVSTKSSFGFLSLQVPGLVRRPLPFARSSDCRSRIVDVEFESTNPEDTEESQSNKDRVAGQPETSDFSVEEGESLLDLSLNADPEIGNLRIPFCDGENCIDVKLGFIADLDGKSYGIGIPYDFAAAITREKKNGSVENLSPESDQNEEFMELMAQQLKETVGDDLRLVRTPRVLTISGPLDKYTSNWKEELLPQSVDTKTLLNQEDEDIESFLDFMRDELGEEEFTKTMNEEHSFDDETLALFSVPGLGDSEDDIADFLKNELMDVSTSPDDEYADRQESIMENVVGKVDLTHDGVALKLVSYCMANGKSYSLVQLLKPIVLVARQAVSSVPNQADADTTGQVVPRFELLSLDELRLVTPRLEELCRMDLERLGLEFDDDDDDGQP